MVTRLSSKSSAIDLLRAVAINGPPVATLLLVTGILLFADVSSVSERDLLQFTLVILGLIAGSMLTERILSVRLLENRTAETQNSLTATLEQSDSGGIISRRASLEALERRLATAQEIWIMGGSLSRLVSSHIRVLERKALEGAKLRFLLLNPASQACFETARSIVYEVKDPSTYSKSVEVTLGQLHSFLLANDALPDGVAAVHVTDIVPTCGMMFVDPEEKHGRAWIELYPFKAPVGDRPVLNLTKVGNKECFGLFLATFEDAWKSSDPWTGAHE